MAGRPRNPKKDEIKKEETTKVEETKDNVLSNEEIFAFMQQQKAEIARLNALIEEKAKEHKAIGSVETDVDILPPGEFTNDDLLETPVAYFTYSESKTLFGYTDSRTRQLVDLPYGNERPIRFKKVYAYRKSSRTGKGDQVHKVARYVCYSKKEKQFLENHPYYEVSIFPSMESAEKIDPTFASKLEDARNQVNSMSIHAVADRSKLLGLDLVEDPNELRRNLIHHLADANRKLDSKISREAIEAMHAARDVVNK